jgi:biopolymer transport protein ExbD
LQFTRPRKRRALVSLTPLIDVVFILLVFFMLVSQFADWRTIRLDAPTEAGDGASLRGAVLVRLHAGGLDVNGRAVASGRLERHLRRALGEGGPARVLVQPGEGVSLQRAVRVLDIATAAGAGDVKLLEGRR